MEKAPNLRFIEYANPAVAKRHRKQKTPDQMAGGFMFKAWQCPATGRMPGVPQEHRDVRSGLLRESKPQQEKSPVTESVTGLLDKSLAVSYSHMGRPHTTIGAKRFHF